MSLSLDEKMLRVLLFLAGIALFIEGCGRDRSSDTITSKAEAQIPPAPSHAALRLATTATGNQARYRVREQLVNVDLPSDAVGSTGAVAGAIAFDSAGRIIPSASRFEVQVSGLTSDRTRREGYVRGLLLETEQYPTVVFALTAVRGLQLPLPQSGSQSFELLGNLTVKGVTRPTAWQVSAQFAPDTVTGTSSTAFTFADFGLRQPRVPVLLSVAGTIRLDYAFRLAPTKF
jgi:polyisoprenoid-binding protein YceI